MPNRHTGAAQEEAAGKGVSDPSHAEMILTDFWHLLFERRCTDRTTEMGHRKRETEREKQRDRERENFD